MPKILIVEDDPAVRDVVEYALSREGMETEAVSSGEAATARLFSDAAFDLVILDLMLPDTDGVTLCRELRSADCASRDVPVIMLTARDDETSVVVGLEVGADDYVTKPFSPRELATRVRTVLRRTNPAADSSAHLSFDGLELDAATREAHLHGEQLRLTAKEFDLLFFLASNPRNVFSRDQLMNRVWGYEAARDTGTVTVHIRRLRAKIEQDPANPLRLETIWGVGYRFLP
jgi:two-component system, OmpR family, alkaline phosphatase synthesis response regulator PhoP